MSIQILSTFKVNSMLSKVTLIIKQLNKIVFLFK